VEKEKNILRNSQGILTTAESRTGQGLQALGFETQCWQGFQQNLFFNLHNSLTY